MRFVAVRVLQAVAMVTIVAVAAFLMLEAAPGDFLTDLKSNPSIPAATVERLQHEFALNQPPAYRLLHWLRSLLLGDFGLSLTWNRPVAELLWPRVRNTALLSFTGLLGAWLLGVPLAAWAAARSGSWGSRAGALVVSVLVAIPDLLLALFMLVAAVNTKWIAVSGSLPGAGLTLALISFPAIYRHTFASVRQVMGEPFVESARAHGLSPLRVWVGHILPAAANPLISLFGLSVSSLLSASLIVEVVLGWPGLGPLLLESVAARDHHVVLAGVVLSACLLAGSNLAVGLLLAVADPRIRKDCQ